MERFEVVCKRCSSSSVTVGILDISESSTGKSVWIIISVNCKECGEVEYIEREFRTEEMSIIHS